MKVYNVLAVDNLTGSYVKLEAYGSLEVALSRAIHIAMDFDCHTVNQDPQPQITPDNIQWIVGDSEDFFVVVIENELLIAIPHFRGDAHQNHSSQSTVPAAPIDAPYDDALPGGWDYQGNPITMKQVHENPCNVQLTYQLTTPQRWALTKARLAKRPHYSILLPGLGTFIQFSALQALGNSWSTITTEGVEIMTRECEYLDNYLEDRLYGELEPGSRFDDAYPVDTPTELPMTDESRFIPRGALRWRGDKCGFVEQANLNPGEDYQIGDEEKCVHCDHSHCLATVERQP